MAAEPPSEHGMNDFFSASHIIIGKSGKMCHDAVLAIRSVFSSEYSTRTLRRSLHPGIRIMKGSSSVPAMLSYRMSGGRRIVIRFFLSDAQR